MRNPGKRGKMPDSSKGGHKSPQITEGLDPQRIDDVRALPLEEMAGARDDQGADAVDERDDTADGSG
jgi:hypothetical protein